MAPRDIVEIVILRLTFIPYLNPQYPSITLTRKRHSPSGSITQVRDWFDRVMAYERSVLPPNTHIRYSDWRIQTGQVGIFMVNGCCFDKVLLVLGEETIYWVFYQNIPVHRRIEGRGTSLPLAYCSCCLNNQYLKIMDTVKKFVTAK